MKRMKRSLGSEVFVTGFEEVNKGTTGPKQERNKRNVSEINSKSISTMFMATGNTAQYMAKWYSEF